MNMFNVLCLLIPSPILHIHTRQAKPQSDLSLKNASVREFFVRLQHTIEERDAQVLELEKNQIEVSINT